MIPFLCKIDPGRYPYNVVYHIEEDFARGIRKEVFYEKDIGNYSYV